MTTKPPPINFATAEEWRTLPPIPLGQPYPKQPDLIQWGSDVLPSVFMFDFVNYNLELKNAERYFTENGWKKYIESVNNFASYNAVVNSKLFVGASAAGAPFVLQQGLLEGVYAWRIQMPINLSYSTAVQSSPVPLVMEVLMVRIPTLNNLSGVAIENITVTKGGGDQVLING